MQMRFTQGSRQTVSSELTPREFHPSDGLPEPPSLPATVLSRSDCDWTGVPLFSLWVIAKSGAARYFESAFLALCLSAGRGVPLHTLMLITITKRKYLANGYSVVKDHSRFRHTKQNRWKEFNPSHLFAHLKAVSHRLKLKFFKKFF